MAREEHCADERNHFGESDGAESQSGVGAFILGQAEDLPGNGDVLNLDGQRPQHNCRQIKAERP